MISQAQLERALACHFGALDGRPCRSEIDLGRYASGDMSADEASAFRPHMESCEECRGVLEVLRRDDKAPAPAPKKASAPSFLCALWDLAERRWLLPTSMAAVGGACLVALLVAVAFRPVPSDTLRPKGGWQLHVVAAHEGRVAAVADGARLVTGDRLGFFYSAPRPGHLAIHYVDASGTAVALFPASGAAASAPVGAGAEVRLEAGAVLSEGHGCEWVVGLFSAEPLPADGAKKVIRTMLENRKGCRLGQHHEPHVDVQTLAVQR